MPCRHTIPPNSPARSPHRAIDEPPFLRTGSTRLAPLSLLCRLRVCFGDLGPGGTRPGSSRPYGQVYLSCHADVDFSTFDKWVQMNWAIQVMHNHSLTVRNFLPKPHKLAFGPPNTISTVQNLDTRVRKMLSNIEGDPTVGTPEKAKTR